MTKILKILEQNNFFWKNINEDTQERPQSRSTIFLRYQKERRGTNKDKTNATYETTDAETKKNCNRGTTFESKHYENTPIQIYKKIYPKNENFQILTLIFFVIMLKT